MKPVIDVSNISKSYQISHQEKASYDTIKDDFAKLIKRPFGGGSQGELETFWALKDINFQVNPGETFGIIGKNGSGKSTLLKILSRIVDPTTGTAKIHGKVASMLEVGTGFHPELTGRENIYFNGSMIGMSKLEITRKFNEIVDFSGVEQFLDTPVKFYSSGMYVRLAFAVAAHLDSEILIIDEVLAVGDTDFQKKSLNKMLSIAKDGRTILFVSHGMSNVQGLCDRAMLLQKGKIKVMGETEKVIDAYLGRTPEAEQASRARIMQSYKTIKGKLVSTDLTKAKRKDGNGKIKLTKVIFKSANGMTGKVVSGEDVEIWAEYELVDHSIQSVDFGLSFELKPGNQKIAQISSTVVDQKISTLGGMVKVLIKKLPLNVGKYEFSTLVSDGSEVLDWINKAGTFEVVEGDFYGSGNLPAPVHGPVLLDYKFEE